MRPHHPAALAALATLCLGLSTRAAEVRVEEVDGQFVARTTAYEATVAADGCLTSFAAAGVEFLKSVPGAIPRGAYPFRNGLVSASATTRSPSGEVVARFDGATIRYAFADDAVRVTIDTSGAMPLLYVAVFDLAVGAVLGDDGRTEKTPTNSDWRTTTWFRGRANVTIAGGTKVWGGWNGGHQVWQADVPAGGSSTMRLRPGTASEPQIAAALAAASGVPPPPPAEPTGPMWDLAALGRAPRTWPADGFTSTTGARAVFFEGPPYRGAPTRVFAWIGIPETKPGTKVPGMVLVHGGGGTAFDSWVRRWTSRGYAAIAMDTCGCVPTGTYGHWARHDRGGPGGWGGWDQIDRAREDQWTYHAVADAILAHSLLRSLPEVDAARTGLTGISWGGYLACIVAGVDARFRFAAPVYGCGFTDEHAFAGSVTGLGPERARRWMRWWDPSAYLKGAAMPMLWVTGSNDFAYTFNALQKSYRLPTGPRTLCIRLRMPHGHGDAGEGPAEVFAFADSILARGEPLPRITAQGRSGRDVWATYTCRTPVAKAELNATSDTGRWQDRAWRALPATLQPGGRVVAELPEGTRVYYLNIFDARGCVVSTEHEELQAPSR